MRTGFGNALRRWEDVGFTHALRAVDADRIADESFVVLDSVLATLGHAARLAGATELSYRNCYREVGAR
ncbi:hypothetical protein [Nocardioides acrostichi]|uniref:Uncharacterized protein n=1 Tax=Nocardioides acrostichi TaxID=2784339 RepID=A0A930V2G6_9ACTN|nr:hypothetical protein [Nocardioides acrostichi]MBF4161974.1 hypothetical protein [Nocardioides acrostichi]